MSLPVKNSVYRIAILGIYHESNTFVKGNTSFNEFKKGRLLKGESISDEYKNAYHEIGGAIEVFTKNNVEILPVFYAEATPGGVITQDACEELVNEMMNELDKVLPVDACFVVPHGAAVAENHRDMDGYWLKLLREKIGNHIPVVGTLDPHANVSELMVSSTRGLFPYSTNPHIDQRETGKKAASFLISLLNNEIKPVQFLFQAPLAISIEQQYTSVEPCKRLYSFANELKLSEDILHINIVIGFPYADVFDMGTSVIIITDNNLEKTKKVKEKLKSYFCKYRNIVLC